VPGSETVKQRARKKRYPAKSIFRAEDLAIVEVKHHTIHKIHTDSYHVIDASIQPRIKSRWVSVNPEAQRTVSTWKDSQLQTKLAGRPTLDSYRLGIVPSRFHSLAFLSL
jgi:hypothetical protein